MSMPNYFAKFLMVKIFFQQYRFGRIFVSGRLQITRAFCYQKKWKAIYIYGWNNIHTCNSLKRYNGIKLQLYWNVLHLTQTEISFYKYRNWHDFQIFPNYQITCNSKKQSKGGLYTDLKTASIFWGHAHSIPLTIDEGHLTRTHKNKNIILPETAIDNQQNWYNNGQDSWAVRKGVDPKKESKSRHTCKQRWTTYCCIVSVELRRNFSTASTTHTWELWKSSPTTAVLLPLVFVPCELINKCSSFVEKKLLYSLQASWETKIK